MITTGKAKPSAARGKAGPTPGPKADAPAAGQRLFATQAEFDAARLNELFWPASLYDSLREGTTSRAGTKLAYEQFLAAAGSPKDPIERMLLEQTWLAHHQVAVLHVQAAKSSNAEVTRLYSAAAVRLMGEVRRTALALRQYRLPPGQKSFTVVSQQNIATGGGKQDVAFVDGGQGQATLHARDEVKDNPISEGDLMLGVNGLPKAKSPRRVAAGRRNGKLRRPWSPEDRQRQRERALAQQPWRFSTGPRTPQGKHRAALNGTRTPRNPGSLRSAQTDVSQAMGMAGQMADLRASLGL